MDHSARMCVVLAALTVGCRSGQTVPVPEAWHRLTTSLHALSLAFQCGEAPMELRGDSKPTTVQFCVARAADTTIDTWSVSGSLLGIRRDWAVSQSSADSVRNSVLALLDSKFGSHKTCTGAPNIAAWNAGGYFVSLGLWGSDVPHLPLHFNIDETVYAPEC
jgi:hypothetical protein